MQIAMQKLNRTVIEMQATHELLYIKIMLFAENI